MENKKAYYAVIPASVRYDSALPPSAKLLYGEITALCNQSGLCWAENSYFAELYEVNIRTVQSWINALLDKGYIFRNIQYADDGKTVIRRCLSIASENTTPVQKLSRGSAESSATAVLKSSPIILQSNTTSNITSNNPPKPPTQKKQQSLEALVGSSEFSQNVKEALLKWLEYKKHKYEEVGLKALLTVVAKKVTEYGGDAVVELINECMSNTWKGIIWEKLLKQQSAASKPKRNYDAEE